jgi:ketosteroid isomerase-like protein
LFETLKKKEAKTMIVSSEIREGIAVANANFMNTFNRGDGAAMGALYTENGQLLPPNSDFVRGQSAISAFWQGAMDMGIKSAKLETVELDGQGDAAFEVGRYSLAGEGGAEIDSGKFIVVWKKEGGKWKLHRDIWNSSKPGSPSP